MTAAPTARARSPRLAVLVCLVLCACADDAMNGAEVGADSALADAADAAEVGDAPLDGDGGAPDSSAADLVGDLDAAVLDGDAVVLSDVASDAPEVVPDAVPADSPGDEPDAPGPWRSALYPDDWYPGWSDEAGRFLHDFSYAGYANGEREPAAPAEAQVFDVVADYAADPSGETDATAAVQAAIDAASSGEGGVVYFPEGLYRFEGRVSVAASGVVLRGAGPERSRLWFPTSEGMSHRSHVTFGGTPRQGDLIPLVEDATTWDTEVAVADASALEVGDDVVLGWTITADFIEEHAMTGVWQAFNDSWQPMAWRTVVAVDGESVPQRVTLDVPLRYPARTRDGAGLRPVSGMISECGVEGLGFSNAVGWHEAWQQDQVHALELAGVRDCWVRDIASFQSPDDHAEDPVSTPHLQSGGLIVRYAKRVTVAESRLGYAQNRGGGGNGYLFEVRQASEVLFRDLVGTAGRHNFIQNWGFGATGIVWLRTLSERGVAAVSESLPTGFTGLSEFHHSLATANLIDDSVADDGWGALNRGLESTGAGHAATQSVFWNLRGEGMVQSAQFGWGYVIGTGPDLRVNPLILDHQRAGTEPADWIEGPGRAETLEPQSLYEDQLRRRLED